MIRKILGGCALAAALVFTVGCGGSSSAPAKTKEQMEKEQKDMIEKQKQMMPGMNKPPEGAAPPADPAKDKDKK
jgi:hypothetical protein